MKKGAILVMLLLVILFVLVVGFIGLQVFSKNEGIWICENGQWVKQGNPSVPAPNTPCPTATNPTYEVRNGPSAQPTEQQKAQISLVPLPTEEDIIRNFFNLIDERKISEAVLMMSKMNIENDSTKQAWGVQFNAIKSINVLQIEKSMEESWSENMHTYKVTLEAYVSSDAANEPIPYYGWSDNPNIRWVQLVRENNLWKINGLGTGP